MLVKFIVPCPDVALDPIVIPPALTVTSEPSPTVNVPFPVVPICTTCDELKSELLSVTVPVPEELPTFRKSVIAIVESVNVATPVPISPTDKLLVVRVESFVIFNVPLPPVLNPKYVFFAVTVLLSIFITPTPLLPIINELEEVIELPFIPVTVPVP